MNLGSTTGAASRGAGGRELESGVGLMIQYYCDLCKRPLDPEQDLRYVVKLEVYAAFDPLKLDDDHDNLQELNEILEDIDTARSDDVSEDVYQALRFDLCPECRRKFLKNPLGRRPAELLDFSQN
jgi:hypothetical protein